MIEDIWTNKPITAIHIKTGDIVVGFTDGKGHFDVYHDHDIFSRYPLSEFTELKAEE